MTHRTPVFVLVFILLGICCNVNAFAGDFGSNHGGGGLDSAKTSAVDSLPSTFEATAVPFQRVIKDPNLDFSLRNINTYDHNSAHWDTMSLNIYGVDMTRFRDTLYYEVENPLKGKKFTFPVKNSWVTSGFGYRRLFGSKFHYGLDVDLETGDEVVAAMDGTVRIARYSNGYGNFVIISHEGGMETLYGHLSELWVSEGMKIRSGELIGLGGSTGRSTGSHLHFEIRIFGEQVDPARVINPETLELYNSRFTVDATWFDHLLGIKDVEYHIVQEGETIDQILEAYEITIDGIENIDQINLDEPVAPGTRLIFRPH